MLWTVFVHPLAFGPYNHYLSPNFKVAHTDSVIQYSMGGCRHPYTLRYAFRENKCDYVGNFRLILPKLFAPLNWTVHRKQWSGIGSNIIISLGFNLLINKANQGPVCLLARLTVLQWYSGSLNSPSGYQNGPIASLNGSVRSPFEQDGSIFKVVKMSKWLQMVSKCA